MKHNNIYILLSLFIILHPHPRACVYMAPHACLRDTPAKSQKVLGQLAEAGRGWCWQARQAACVARLGVRGGQNDLGVNLPGQARWRAS